MFKPMAMTFSFALLGAMLFCFLFYVPVAASLFLKPKKENPNSFSNRLINKLNFGIYPVIKWAYKHQKVLYGGCGFYFSLRLFCFSTMGGEFIPQLDEGRFRDSTWF